VTASLHLVVIVRPREYSRRRGNSGGLVPPGFENRLETANIADVPTPVMWLGDHGLAADGGEMMVRALKYRKFATVMVRFPRENHELSRSGEPKHRVERLQHIVGWMDQWLQGKKTPAYSTN
jgi:hypothetical protein